MAFRSRQALHEAAFSGELRTLRKLVEEAGGDVNEKDEVGLSPLHRAAMNGQLECVKYLLERGSLINASNVAGCTALHFAAGNGYLEVVKYLVETAHANLAHKTNKGHTARDMAKSRGQCKIVSYINQIGNPMGGNWMT